MSDPDLPLVAYGHWPSPLMAASLFDKTETISWVRPASKGLFFLLSLPEEGNAQVLMYQSTAGGSTRISPPGMNVRSQVHEYGGLPYTFTDDMVFYCNFSDQRVYRQNFNQLLQNCGAPAALTPLDAAHPKALRYADFIVDASRQRLLCVREDHRENQAEPANTLVALPMHGVSAGEILFGDSDFVASPCLSADGQRIAFQTWSHPDMPWDHTRIQLGTFADGGTLATLWPICAEQSGALVQPAFSPQGDLYFIADWNDWWNLYRIDARNLDAATGSDAAAVYPVAAELCAPQWQLGQHSYDFVDADTLLLSLNRDCVWQLALLHVLERKLTVLEDGLGRLEHVFSRQGRAIFFAASATEAAAIYSINLDACVARTCLVRGRAGAILAPDTVSVPQHIRYPTVARIDAFALHYPPRNPACTAPAGDLPPLLVSVHGGPTSSANSAYNPAVQFWTSRGFGWLDVNHRGSTGYGRKFRRSLNGEWGVVDIEDIVSAVEHMIADGRADPQRIAIRGASAGGFAVLAALAASSLFSAGVSYYGIGDLELLARDTHKFESRYMDQLIGPYPVMAARYRERSPLHNIDKITAPVLLLQGMQDKVVPPNQAATIYSALKAKNSQTRCVYFDDEGHGFRKPHNQLAALQAELAFYTELFL